MVGMAITNGTFFLAWPIYIYIYSTKQFNIQFKKEQQQQQKRQIKQNQLVFALFRRCIPHGDWVALRVPCSTIVPFFKNVLLCCCLLYRGIWTEFILYSLALYIKRKNVFLSTNNSPYFSLFYIFLQSYIRMYFNTEGAVWWDVGLQLLHWNCF